MAVDDLKTEYHLTPNGWVTGTSYFFGKTKKEMPRPSDAILTMVDHTYQSSRWSAEENSWTERWRAAGVTDEQIAELQRKFPKP